MELLWEARGSIIYKKEHGERESRDDESTEKTAQDTKDGESSPPNPKCRRSQTQCAGGGNRWLSRNWAQGLLLCPLSAPSSQEVPGPMEPGSQPILLDVVEVWNQQDLGCVTGDVIRAGEAAKLVKYLPCMYEVLDSIFRTTSHILYMVDQVGLQSYCLWRQEDQKAQH